MELKYIIPPLLAVPVGIITFILTNYCMKPLLKYRKIKFEIASDLIYYDNTVEIDGGGESHLAKLRLKKTDKFKRHASNLKSAFFQLPKWHYIHFPDCEERPLDAVKSLMAYANSTNRETAQTAIDEIKSFLKLPF